MGCCKSKKEEDQPAFDEYSSNKEMFPAAEQQKSLEATHQTVSLSLKDKPSPNEINEIIINANYTGMDNPMIYGQMNDPIDLQIDMKQQSEDRNR